MTEKVIAILSGGLDSAVALAYIDNMPEYEVVHAVSFWYGQRHTNELVAAQNIRDWFGIPGTIITLDTTAFEGTSTLMSRSREGPPTGRAFEEMTKEIASTFVPGRNLIFISYAAAFAYKLDAHCLVGGWHVDDSSGYPDCREEFLDSAERAVQLALDREIQVLRPLVPMNKAGIIRQGYAFDVPFRLTRSCYYGRVKACGRCDTCLLRLRGFQEAGLLDPIKYDHIPEEYRNAVEA